MTTIEFQQAKEHFFELIELVISGEEVIIAKGGQPLVRVTTAQAPLKQRPFGSARGKIQIADDFDELPEEFQEYM